MLYHYVYKTKHKNGRYYIGRHTTPDLNDGYLGSGVWVSGIKNKKDLVKEILLYTHSTQELKQLEEQLIAQHYNDPLCMNRGLGSNGWTSEEAKAENAKRVSAGTHNFLDGEIPKRTQLRRVANGTHPWIGQKIPAWIESKMEHTCGCLKNTNEQLRKTTKKDFLTALIISLRK